MKLKFLVVASLATLGAVNVQAQSMKPGVWEMNTKMGGNPKIDQAREQMQKQMASMPPEQRKMMQDMMAKQGISMSAGAGGGMAIKSCVTKEMSDRNEMPTQQQGDCKTTTSDRTSTGMKMKWVCTNPPSEGDGVVSFPNNESYTMKMNIRHVSEGKPETMTMDISGKWLGADCGTLKPMQVPQAAKK